MGIEALIPGHLQHLKVLSRARTIIRGARYDLRDFCRFPEERYLVTSP